MVDTFPQLWATLKQPSQGPTALHAAGWRVTKHPALDDKTSPHGANGEHHKSLMVMMIDKEGHAKEEAIKIHKYLSFIKTSLF